MIQTRVTFKERPGEIQQSDKIKTKTHIKGFRRFQATSAIRMEGWKQSIILVWGWESLLGSGWSVTEQQAQEMAFQ